jgi:hypothetical protein
MKLLSEVFKSEKKQKNNNNKIKTNKKLKKTQTNLPVGL